MKKALKVLDPRATAKSRNASNSTATVSILVLAAVPTAIAATAATKKGIQRGKKPCNQSWKETLMHSSLKFKKPQAFIPKAAIARSQGALKNTVNAFRAECHALINVCARAAKTVILRSSPKTRQIISINLCYQLHLMTRSILKTRT
jgi:hypothetical protein